jgi:outer membrane protein assembly factor BamB
MRPIIRVSAILACATLVRCGGDPPVAADPHAELERLRALGYVGFTDTQVAPGEAPVTDHDEGRSAPGYNLISNRDLSSAQLFDARGRLVHSWVDPDAQRWSNAELLPDGDLLVTGSDQLEGGVSNFLLRLSWNGAVVWRVPLNAHHDAELTPSGTIATLEFVMRTIPEVSAEIPVKDSDLVLLTPEGTVLERHSLYDLLCGDPQAFRCRPAAPKVWKNATFIDMLHPNSVEFMRHGHLAACDPLYAPTNVLVSFRHQDAIAVFDWQAKRLVWSWGPGQISGQHDATVLESGNILLFDNGIDRLWSRIVELEPKSGRIVWEYKAADPPHFFSLRKGTSQRLPNGNTLVANSDSGEAFEVTPAGDIVWRFLNPNTDDRGNRATILRIHRHDEGWIQERMRRHGPTP